jgi:hypothetical protein
MRSGRFAIFLATVTFAGVAVAQTPPTCFYEGGQFSEGAMICPKIIRAHQTDAGADGKEMVLPLQCKQGKWEVLRSTSGGGISICAVCYNNGMAYSEGAAIAEPANPQGNRTCLSNGRWR